MKKIIVIAIVILSTSLTILAQTAKVEVLYFKANLACCKAKSCNALEAEIQYMISSHYTDGSVAFKEIKLVDTTNNTLIEKYKAKSQTVIIVKKKKKKETSIDVSDIVQKYIQDKNKEEFNTAFYSKIDSLLK